MGSEKRGGRRREEKARLRGEEMDGGVKYMLTPTRTIEENLH